VRGRDGKRDGGWKEDRQREREREKNIIKHIH
jgi:hypothetical protein